MRVISMNLIKNSIIYITKVSELRIINLANKAQLKPTDYLIKFRGRYEPIRNTTEELLQIDKSGQISKSTFHKANNEMLYLLKNTYRTEIEQTFETVANGHKMTIKIPDLEIEVSTVENTRNQTRRSANFQLHKEYTRRLIQLRDLQQSNLVQKRIKENKRKAEIECVPSTSRDNTQWITSKKARTEEKTYTKTHKVYDNTKEQYMVDNIAKLCPNDIVAIDVENVVSKEHKALPGFVAVVRMGYNKDDRAELIYSAKIQQKPSDIHSYATKWSGLRPKDLSSKAIPFSEVKEKLISIVKHRKVVGLGLDNDLDVLEISEHVMKHNRIDYKNIFRDANNQAIGLRKLAYVILGKRIQEVGTKNKHNPIEDARMCIRIYKKYIKTR